MTRLYRKPHREALAILRAKDKGIEYNHELLATILVVDDTQPEKTIKKCIYDGRKCTKGSERTNYKLNDLPNTRREPSLHYFSSLLIVGPSCLTLYL